MLLEGANDESCSTIIIMNNIENTFANIVYKHTHTHTHGMLKRDLWEENYKHLFRTRWRGTDSCVKLINDSYWNCGVYISIL